MASHDAQELAGAHSTGTPAINLEGLSSHGPDPSRSHPVQHLKGREGKLHNAKTTLAYNQLLELRLLARALFTAQTAGVWPKGT